MTSTASPLTWRDLVVDLLDAADLTRDTDGVVVVDRTSGSPRSARARIEPVRCGRLGRRLHKVAQFMLLGVSLGREHVEATSKATGGKLKRFVTGSAKQKNREEVVTWGEVAALNGLLHALGLLVSLRPERSKQTLVVLAAMLALVDLRVISDANDAPEVEHERGQGSPRDRAAKLLEKNAGSVVGPSARNFLTNVAHGVWVRTPPVNIEHLETEVLTALNAALDITPVRPILRITNTVNMKKTGKKSGGGSRLCELLLPDGSIQEIWLPDSPARAAMEREALKAGVSIALDGDSGEGRSKRLEKLSAALFDKTKTYHLPDVDVELP